MKCLPLFLVTLIFLLSLGCNSEEESSSAAGEQQGGPNAPGNDAELEESSGCEAIHPDLHEDTAGRCVIAKHCADSSYTRVEDRVAQTVQCQKDIAEPRWQCPDASWSNHNNGQCSKKVTVKEQIGEDAACDRGGVRISPNTCEARPTHPVTLPGCPIPGSYPTVNYAASGYDMPKWVQSTGMVCAMSLFQLANYKDTLDFVSGPGACPGQPGVTSYTVVLGQYEVCGVMYVYRSTGGPPGFFYTNAKARHSYQYGDAVIPLYRDVLQTQTTQAKQITNTKRDTQTAVCPELDRVTLSPEHPIDSRLCVVEE